MTEGKQETVLEVKDLHLELLNRGTYTEILKGISFSLNEGKILGILGESGSGKSMTMNAVTGLLPRKSARIRGRICLEQGKNILEMDARSRQKYCASKTAIILQDAINALSPYDRIGTQMKETVKLHHPELTPSQRQDMICRSLEQIGIPSPKMQLRKYPHQFSGGMRQRIAIAMALVSNSRILIADEPTTSLDAVNQLKFVRLLKEIQGRRQISMIYISHNLGLIASLCSRVLVMKDGEIVERGKTEEVLYSPKHAYTRELVNSTRKLYT